MILAIDHFLFLMHDKPVGKDELEVNLRLSRGQLRVKCIAVEFVLILSQLYIKPTVMFYLTLLAQLMQLFLYLLLLFVFTFPCTCFLSCN